MIKYSLKCPDDHRFDSWFASADAFDAVQRSGHLTCAICGAGDVQKAIMAPQVRPARAAETRGALTEPASPAEQALRHLRQQIEANSDYVGENFAVEARAMHSGDAPERAIYGEANLAEARSLIEDGVPITPLPFAPKRKAN